LEKKAETSISKNLIVSLVVVLTGVVLFLVITHSYISAIHAKKSLEEKARGLLDHFVKSIEYPMWNFDTQNLNKIADAYFLSEFVSELVVMDGEKRKVVVKGESHDQNGVIVKERPVFHDGETIGYVKVGLTKKYLYQRINRLILVYCIIGIVLIGMVVGVTGILLRVFLKKPFEDLSLGMDRISQGDYFHDLTSIRQKEFSLIVEKFEKMAEKIQEREASLNKAKTYINDIFNAMDSILVGVDAGGNITHWNNNAETFAGCDMEHARKEKFETIFPVFTRRAGLVTKAIMTRTPQADLKFAVAGNSRQQYYSISVFPLSSKGEKGAVVRINDVSQRVHLEEMMIQTEKMVSVGGLAAGMAHEINNPLAGMIQNAQVLENRLAVSDMPANVKAAKSCGVSMETIRNYMEARQVLPLLASLREAGERAAKIVDNMLSFSRKSGSGFMQCDLTEVLDTTLDLAANDYDLKKKFDFKSIEIKKEYQENLPAVFCDVSKMQQVMLNILKNGAHAMFENSKQKQHPCFVLRIRQGVNEVIVEIEDNGPGMEAETRKRVFEPFFTTKPVGVGTGLGLSVSYFIVVENHNGSISVESSKSSGTKFIVRLPENTPL